MSSIEISISIHLPNHLNSPPKSHQFTSQITSIYLSDHINSPPKSPQLTSRSPNIYLLPQPSKHTPKPILTQSNLFVLIRFDQDPMRTTTKWLKLDNSVYWHRLQGVLQKAFVAETNLDWLVFHYRAVDVLLDLKYQKKKLYRKFYEGSFRKTLKRIP